MKSKNATIRASSNEFLRGDSTSDECEPLFKQYKSCLTVNLTFGIPSGLRIRLHFERLIDERQKALKEQGIDQLLDDARESNRENDLEHLKRTCESDFAVVWMAELRRN
ncbi:MAG: hypothetical protein LQ350_002490 [Teloschistes chrysophthalmus]|nr:MAG: hypothetical protein LQ350_002490 [Niorma chrysophthalma]